MAKEFTPIPGDRALKNGYDDSASLERAKTSLERLEEPPSAPRLPLVADPTALSQPPFVRHKTKLGRDQWASLNGRAGQSGLTPSSVLLAAFSDVLNRWSEAPGFCLNFAVLDCGLPQRQTNEIDGEFTVVMTLEIEAPATKSFEERARRLQDHLVRNCRAGIERRTESMPVVFTSLLLTDISSYDREVSSPREKSVYGEPSGVWLNCTVHEDNGDLVVIWDVVESMFPTGMFPRMFDAFTEHLAGLAAEELPWTEAWHDTARRLVGRFELERQQAADRTSLPLSNDLLHELFCTQALDDPDRPAIISDRRSLSFGELDNLSNRLAEKLRALGAQSNTLVAVVMEKGWEQIVAVLGILRAGAAYLPIDASLPNDRIQKLLKHGEATIALTQPRYLDTIEWPGGVQAIALREEEIISFPPLFEEVAISSDQLAYVIYTSGSTGEPKGVMIDHRGAVNTILDINSRFDISATDRLLALSSLSFDLSVYDVFGSLAAGAAIVIPKAESMRDPSHWADHLNRHNVTVWNSVPAFMDLLADYLQGHPQAQPRNLRLALLSGDWIPLGLPDAIRKFARSLSVVSLGGATEASIWSILHPIHSLDPNCSSVPYGRAMKNQGVHVLDADLLPCPPWVPGELFISGIGLAKGYWRDPQRTAASFFDHPLTGERLYRTGDSGRYLPDGNIEFLGRNDTQVKLQGFRVELGEIEATLARHPAVAKVVVVTRGQRDARKHLVAYGIAKQGESLPAASQLQEFLARHLPEYMIPATYIELDALPLTPNGKVDRRALPEPSDYTASPPKTKAELSPSLSQMHELVADALGEDNVDTEANLLERGVNSIDMIRIANRIDEALGFRPSVVDFYKDPSIAGLARSYEEFRLELGEDVHNALPDLVAAVRN